MDEQDVQRQHSRGNSAMGKRRISDITAYAHYLLETMRMGLEPLSFNSWGERRDLPLMRRKIRKGLQDGKYAERR